MASIRRKPNSRYWIACFTDSKGRQRQRSTGTTDRKLAASLADDFERTYQYRKTESQVRHILSDIHQELHGRPISVPTVEDFSVQWLAAKKGEVKKDTHSEYSSVIPEFIRHLGDSARRPIVEVVKDHVVKYRDACAKKVSANRANYKIKVLRAFFQAAWDDEIIPNNPATAVKPLKQEDSIRRGYTTEELRAVIAAADDEWQGMVILGFYTAGQRLKDIASMTADSIDFENGVITFSTSKTGRTITMPLAAPALSWLRSHKLNKPGGPIFPRAYETVERTDDTSQLSNDFYKILVKAKLAAPRSKSHRSEGIGRGGKRRRNPLSFHSLRHTTTSFLKMKGVSGAIVRDLVGHDSVEVSRQYTHIDHGPKRSALNKLPDITTAA